MDWEHNDNYLIHYGILGQKWGVRRYQNKDGTLTESGKKRYGADLDEVKSNMEKAQKRETQLRRRSEDLNSRTGLKAILTTNDFKNARAKKKAVKASKKAAELEGVYERMKNAEKQDGPDEQSAKLSTNFKENINNFDKLSKEDRKKASEEIFRELTKLVDAKKEDEAEKYAHILYDKIDNTLPEDLFMIDAKDPISEENNRLYKLDSEIDKRRSEIEKQIGYKETWYSSKDSPAVHEQKRQQEIAEWDRLMKAMTNDATVQKLCREQKGSHDALIKKIINHVGLSDSENVIGWVETIMLGNPTFDYHLFMQK